MITINIDPVIFSIGHFMLRWYSLMRFSLAFTSSYKIIAFGLTQSQIVALAVLLTTLPMLVWM